MGGIRYRKIGDFEISVSISSFPAVAQSFNRDKLLSEIEWVQIIDNC